MACFAFPSAATWLSREALVMSTVTKLQSHPTPTPRQDHLCKTKPNTNKRPIAHEGYHTNLRGLGFLTCLNRAHSHYQPAPLSLDSYATKTKLQPEFYGMARLSQNKSEVSPTHSALAFPYPQRKATRRQSSHSDRVTPAWGFSSSLITSSHKTKESYQEHLYVVTQSGTALTMQERPPLCVHRRSK